MRSIWLEWCIQCEMWVWSLSSGSSGSLLFLYCIHIYSLIVNGSFVCVHSDAKCTVKMNTHNHFWVLVRSITSDGNRRPNKTWLKPYWKSAFCSFQRVRFWFARSPKTYRKTKTTITNLLAQFSRCKTFYCYAPSPLLRPNQMSGLNRHRTPRRFNDDAEIININVSFFFLIYIFASSCFMYINSFVIFVRKVRNGQWPLPAPTDKPIVSCPYKYSQFG